MLTVSDQSLGTDLGSIVVRLDVVKAAKEKREDRRITWELASEETKIAYTTMLRWVHGSTRRYDQDVLLRFCEYFDCQPGDILVYEGDEEDASEPF